jgi:hypothetical protein
VIAAENCAEINIELVERLAKREGSDWTYFSRLRHERKRKLREPQDVLIEAESPAAAAEEAPGTSDAELRNNSPPLAACFGTIVLWPLKILRIKGLGKPTSVIPFVHTAP